MLKVFLACVKYQIKDWVSDADRVTIKKAIFFSLTEVRDHLSKPTAIKSKIYTRAVSDVFITLGNRPYGSRK